MLPNSVQLEATNNYKVNLTSFAMKIVNFFLQLLLALVMVHLVISSEDVVEAVDKDEEYNDTLYNLDGNAPAMLNVLLKLVRKWWFHRKIKTAMN